MAGDSVLHITDENFKDEVLQSNIPVLVDFWAPWCGPCLIVGPIIEELAQSYSDRIKFCKLNVQENPLTPGDYGVSAIPTLIIFKDGQEVDRIVGALPKAKLEEALKRFV